MGKKNRRNQVVAGDQDPAAVPAYHDEDDRLHHNQNPVNNHFHRDSQNF